MKSIVTRSLLLLAVIPSSQSFAPPSPSRTSCTALQAATSTNAPPQARLEAILFDCDGVLADTERDGHRISFNMAFRRNDLDDQWDEERYGVLLEVGGGKERMMAHWDEVGYPSQFPSEHIDRLSKIKELHLQKTDIFNSLITQGSIPLRPGVLRLVDEAIANNVKLAVCSTSNELAVRNLVYTLMGKERGDLFEIFAGDMVKRKKPSPDVYLMAVERMKLNRDHCVIIEDSGIGVKAAVGAGISCLVTKSSYTKNEDFTGAKLIVDELGEDERTGVTLETLRGLLDVTAGVSNDAATIDLSDNTVTSDTSITLPSTGSRGIGVTMERHIEKGGASWTGARFGDTTQSRRGYSYTPSATYAASSSRGIGVQMEGHIERGGASWTGARFGQDESQLLQARGGYQYTPSETYEASSSTRGIGVKMQDHIEKGGASWTGARLGDDNMSDSKRGGPTPSRWHE